MAINRKIAQKNLSFDSSCSGAIIGLVASIGRG